MISRLPTLLASSVRLHSATEEAQIGMVWHASFVEEIIAMNAQDT